MQKFTRTILASAALLTAVISTSTVQAQDYYANSRRKTGFEEKNLRLGLSINPNVGWFRYNDDDFDAGSKAGFSYGLLADVGFARNYYFSTGLLINSIATSVTPPTTSKDNRERELIRLQYVEVPLTIKLKSEENDLGRFYGQFGFTAGFKVSGKEQIAGSNKKTGIDKDDLFRLGLQVGGGAEWKLGENLGVLTGLTFNNGFTRAINNEGKPKTSFVALNLGILF